MVDANHLKLYLEAFVIEDNYICVVFSRAEVATSGIKNRSISILFLGLGAGMIINLSAMLRRTGRIAAPVCILLSGASANAMGLKEAISIALISNPQIGQAIQNHEAMGYQLEQARGLYLPRLDFEGSAGFQQYDRRDSSLVGGKLNQNLGPAEAGLVLTQKIFDGFATQAENERQIARVAGGVSRIWERSENIALSIAREYIQVALQQRVLSIAQDNVAFHRKTLSEIESSVSSGTLTDADKFQAEERLTASVAKVKQAEEELDAAKIKFFTFVGKPVGSLAPLPNITISMPKTLESALGKAQLNNPTVAIAWSDIDAADALVKAARAKYLPEVSLEGRARAGHDIDINPGRTTDLQARLVMKWNLYDGGIKSAAEKEQISLSAQERSKLDQTRREIGEQVKLAWNTREREAALSRTFSKQLDEGVKVVSSYQDQFKVGRRSLLDVLDAQNTRFNTAVLVETARMSSLFANYQLLAADGDLLKMLNINPPSPDASQFQFKDAEVRSSSDIIK